MNLSIAQLVGRMVHRPAVMATVQKELGVDRLRAQRLVDGAVDLLLPEIKTQVRDHTRRNTIFASITQADNTLEQRLLHDNHRESALVDATSLLQSLLGPERPKQLLSVLQSNESATDTEAELAMAFAASGTLASLQTKLADGTGDDNAAGFANLFADTSSSGQGSNAGITADSLKAQAYLTTEENEEYRWLRYLLPLMLLALLLVTMLKACAESDQNAQLSQQRDQLQQELQTTQLSVNDQGEKLNAVNRDYAAARLQITDLQNTVQQNRAELAALQANHATAMADIEKYANLPTDTVALQERLLRTDHERDQSAKEIARINQSLQNTSAELQHTLDVNTALRVDLDRAQQNTQTQTDTIAALRNQVSETVSNHNQTVRRLATTRESLEQLQIAKTQEITTLEDQIKMQQSRIGHLLPRLDALNEEVAALTKDRDSAVSALDEQVATHSVQIEKLTELDTSKTLEISTLNDQVKAQETLIGELQYKSDELVEEVATITAAKDNAVLALGEANDTIEQLRIDGKAQAGSHQTQVNTLQSQMNNALEARNNSDSALGEQLQHAATQAVKIEQLQAEIHALQEEKAAAEAQVVALQQTASDASDNIARLQSEITTLENTVSLHEIQITNAETALGKTRTELSATTDERNTLLAARDELTAKIDELTAENQSTRDQLNAIDEELTVTRDALTSANTNTDLSTARLKVVEANLTQVTGKLKESENNEAAVNSQLQTAQTEIDQLRAAIEAAENSDDKLRARLKESRQRVVTFTDDNKVQQQTLATLKKQATQLKAERDQNNIINANKIRTLEKLVADSDNQVDQLTAEISTLRDKIVNAQVQAGTAARKTLEVRDSIARHIAESDLGGVSVEAIENNNAVAITVGPGNIYRKGEVALSREGTLVLSKIANMLSEYPQWQIDVEGHTDATPIGQAMKKRYPSNWELSVARASVVVNYLSLVSDVDSQSMSARGYADTRPVASNANALGRRQNRRIEIVLRR